MLLTVMAATKIESIFLRIGQFPEANLGMIFYYVIFESKTKISTVCRNERFAAIGKNFGTSHAVSNVV